MSRPIDLRPGFCSIRGQGDLGSCTAFAATAILEYISVLSTIIMLLDACVTWTLGQGSRMSSRL